MEQVVILSAVIFVSGILISALKYILVFLNECLILWRTTTDGRHAFFSYNYYFCPTMKLDHAAVKEVFRYAAKKIKHPVAQDENQFYRSMYSSSHVVLMRKRTDGSLRGLMLLNMTRRIHNGNEHGLFDIGLHYSEKESENFYLFFLIGCQMLKELVLHPTRPVYLTSQTDGYKNNVLAAINHSSSMLRHKSRTTNEGEIEKHTELDTTPNRDLFKESTLQQDSAFSRKDAAHTTGRITWWELFHYLFAEAVSPEQYIANSYFAANT